MKSPISAVTATRAGRARNGLASCALLAGLLCAESAHAAAGDLDRSFGLDGRVLTNIGDRNSSGGRALALQPDGKVVVAGSAYNGTNDDIAVVRYNADGSLDTSFADDGKQVTEVGTSFDRGNAVALQSDGKIVVAGDSVIGLFSARVGFVRDIAVVRYNPDGSLDTSFGGDPTVTTDAGADYDSAVAVAVQGDGRIVVAGRVGIYVEDDQFVLLRYNPDGSLDSTFGAGGKVLTPGTPYDLVLQADGKIVVSGSLPGDSDDMTLRRFNPDGSIDSTFGGSGTVTTILIAGCSEPARAVTVQSDGKIVVAGNVYRRGVPDIIDFAVVRYNPDGSRDTSFGAGGSVITDLGNDSEDAALAVAVQADGKIVAAGLSGPDRYHEDFAVVRYNPDGSLDPTFGTDGKIITPLGADYDEAHGVAIQADGKIVAAGMSGDDDGILPSSLEGADSSFAVVRYNPDGSLDATFDAGGQTLTRLGGTTDWITALAVQGDGKIVAAGFDAVVNSDFVVARYDADGTPDGSFDNDGKTVVATEAANFDFLDPVAVKVQSDGKIVAAKAGGGGIVAVRLEADGAPDASFGVDGRATVPIGSTIASTANASMALQADGKIVVSGDSALVRFNADGTPDSSFDGDGTKIVGDTVWSVKAVEVQTDGKIVIAGDGIRVARFNPDGSPDTGFGDNGAVSTSLGPDGGSARAVAVQNDGKVVVAGHVVKDARYSNTSADDDHDFIVIRYNPDGSLDTGFGTNGIVTTSFGDGRDVAYSLALQNNGKIVVAGETYIGENGAYGYAHDSDFAVARYNPDGSPDSSFSGDGKRTTDFARTSDHVRAVAVQPDGRIVVGGVSYGPHGADFALVRYSGAGDCGAPRAGCRAAGQGTLAIKRASDDRKDKLQFSWLRGTATKAELSDPLGTARYTLCVYDQSEAVLEATLLPAETCNGKPCWVEDSEGYKYKDKFGVEEGVTRVQLQGSGTSAKAKILMKGKGANLLEPALPLTGPVLVQLVNEDSGLCFEATFDSAGVVRNDGEQFKAKVP